MLDTARTHRYTRRQRSIWRKVKKASACSQKKEKVIAVGVKNGCFGVKNEKTDSQMLSLKYEEISLA